MRDVTAAVQWVVKKMQRHGLNVIVRNDAPPLSLDEDVLTVTYQAVHELLFNVLKHAATSVASVAIKRRGAFLRIVVRDWGRGFLIRIPAVPGRDGGFGLFNLSEQLDPSAVS